MPACSRAGRRDQLHRPAAEPRPVYRDKSATDAFWSDVLTSAYHGHTDGYATVNGSVGVKWQDGAVTTTVKVTNLFNQTIQQHIFGDLLRRTVVGEVKFKL